MHNRGWFIGIHLDAASLFFTFRHNANVTDQRSPPVPPERLPRRAVRGSGGGTSPLLSLFFYPQIIL